ncbi:MAG: hypothetical protein COW04_11355 [Deltaproteobacteria bacterium CG12_big_fil_rev_8_21_14_0_65_43_10]|nr:MAG: hypothetical protein AUK23_10425 [Deltaproteobacteria bacterium CG2_30_43_15]PIQ44742.1 MAG: hypothetical protein COW04_11355 [Deltaproteobacteria bacterium CG12_big_fil_rev_8_21_14_0_65_43_10]PIU86083.1 MAG: hypothetical protein COS67_04375 [Deltaproteobacteria bacterium CG06_land_8_20_14_3_00_44_19]PIX23586.1 MAG: hypothetical protein COZ68_09030 [Deltaproteobacteria bacterium CG_4_8_14_3_um_filter_43_13]PIZ19787.1 MAG: hypothetical protein COY50_08210 [Deltaproteobacteria bacterium C
MSFTVDNQKLEVRDTAQKGKETFQSILEIRNEVEKAILSLGKKARNANLLLNYLYSRPIITPKEVAEMLSTTHQSASSLIRDFESLNILKKWEKTGRSQTYIFGRYFALFLD